MKFMLFLSIILLVVGCEKNKQYKVGDFVIINNLLSDIKSRKPITGNIVLYYPDGKTKAIAHYKDGILDGDEKLYFNSRMLKAEYFNKNGLQTGPCSAYYESGKLRLKTLYYNGKVNGGLKIYHENGKLSLESHYNEGKLDGTEYSYDEFGYIQTEIQYKNGNALSGYHYSDAGRKIKMTSSQLRQVSSMALIHQSQLEQSKP